MDLAIRIAHNGPTGIVYSAANLPASDDPGWVITHHRQTGEEVRAISVHGPFEVEPGARGEQRCESGWLVLDADGLHAVADDVYALNYEEGD